MKKIFIIQNVPHENLGVLENSFLSQGFTLRYFNPQELIRYNDSAFNYDALIMMGGPMSVYDTTEFPHLIKAAQVIRMAYTAGKPVLGICLGAQMIAKAFEAKVVKNTEKEIGWYPLNLTPAGETDAVFSSFSKTETVFQWHGDTFNLPHGAVLLASSPLCQNQAFRLGKNIYGLQFHVEVSAAMVAEWLDENGNKEELSCLPQIDSKNILSNIPTYIGRLNFLCQALAKSFEKMI
ncbi:type 1 glutamine amidotransferase [bacterium]|nr:type 1 glutamine amidotransferase [bacterium]